MQGDVSKTGGTDAGVFPKYKNDININKQYSIAITTNYHTISIHYKTNE